MKKFFFVFLLMLIVFASGLFCLPPGPERQAQSDPWLAKSLACCTPDGAAKLLPDLEKMKGNEKYLYLGIVCHNLAANGLGEYIPKAIDYCRQASEKKPSPLALGYLGSALTLQAGNDFRKNDMQAAMQNLQEGVRQLDEGVAQSPKNVSLRILRVENSLALSEGSPLNREDKIKEDMAFLKSAYDSLPAELRSFFYLKEAQLYLKSKNIDLAAQSFEKAIQAAPASANARQAQAALAKLEK
jgi:tetratricopeptide (TPR) repeat protein